MVVLKILLVFTALLVAYKVPLVSCASLGRVSEPEPELDSTSTGIHGAETSQTEGKTPSKEQTTDVQNPSRSPSVNIQPDDQPAPLDDDSPTSDFVSSQELNGAPEGKRSFKQNEKHVFGNMKIEIKNEKPASITDEGSTDEFQVPEPTKLKNEKPREKNEYHASEHDSESIKEVVPKMVEIKHPSLPESNTKQSPVGRELLGSATNNNAHTITSSDFAELTGANGNKNQEQSSNKIDNTDVKPETTAELPTVNTNKPNPQGTSTNGNLDPDNKGSSVDRTEEQTRFDQNRITEDKIDTSGNENPRTNILTKPSAGTSSTNQDFQSKSGIVSQLALRMADELKVYSNEVALAWNDETWRGTGWTAEAASELKTYLDKIVIAQAVNPDCVQEDIGKHAARKKALHEVLETCRAAVKREEWLELQEKTKEALNTIDGVVQEETMDLNRLIRDEDEVCSKTALIENNAKKKLEEVNMESVKETLSTLKEKSMKKDEEDFRTCVNEKPEKAMIEDTLKDIMRIKNNCVG